MENPAIVPSSHSLPETDRRGKDCRRLNRAVRAALVLIAAGLTVVFALAWWLKPDPRGLGTHQQLGLPPCSFHWVTGLPCPSCGMTTSFSHLMHGDVRESLKANPVGTLLAGLCLAAIPWCVLSGLLGRRLLIGDFDMFAAYGVTVLLVLLLGAWGIRLGLLFFVE